MTGTRAAVAAQRLAALGYGPAGAASVVDVVFDVLAEPDRDMLEAGLDQLTIAMGAMGLVTDRADGRDLVRVMWCAMLDRVR